ncbi:hypothetical protein BVX95_00350 [archaeon D22]|nr:hypothetical protein BVX95_00350 [archaeon D22]
MEETMTQIYPPIRSMTFDEQLAYGLCNKGLMMEHGEVAYRLTSGTTDSLHVYKAGGGVYVLTVNLRLDYVALDYYQGSEPEPIDSIFLQGEWAIEECLGRRWRNLSAATLASRLANQFA